MARTVRVDIERWEVLALNPLNHWCSKCKRIHDFQLDERSHTWYNEVCGGKVIVQQLIIEGLLNESKYLGIEGA